MAISTGVKSFISSPPCQKVINQIYSGDVVFSVAATRSILADNYKPRSIQLYDPREAPFLDHYRSVLFLRTSNVLTGLGYVFQSMV